MGEAGETDDHGPSRKLEADISEGETNTRHEGVSCLIYESSSLVLAQDADKWSTATIKLKLIIGRRTETKKNMTVTYSRMPFGEAYLFSLFV